MPSDFDPPTSAREWKQELDTLITRHRAPDWTKSVTRFFSDAGMGLGPSDEHLIDLEWYGPVQQLITDSERPATDVLINGPGKEIVMVVHGARRLTGITPDPSWISWLQKQLALQSGLVTPQAPEHWPRLAGCSEYAIIGMAKRKLRFACTRAPLTSIGATLALRVLPKKWPTLENLIQQGVMTTEVVDVLTKAMQRGVTILFCGGTGSGKTTSTAAFLQHIGENARIVVIEEASELPELADSVHMEVLRSGMSFSDCVRLSLRQKPDYVAVGEVRSGEAMAMLQAAATGHPGIGTIHASDAQLALQNLERMATEEGSVPATTVRGMVGTSVTLLVAHIGWYGAQQKRRCVGEVIEVLAGEGDPGGKYTVQQLFAYDPYRDAVIRKGGVQGAWGNREL